MLCSPLLAEPRTLLPGPLRAWIGRRLSGPPAGPRSRSRRACFFAFGRIGDFVLALSTLRLLARELGPDQCTIIVSPTLAPLAAAEVPGAEILVLPSEAGGLLREIAPIWARERRKFSPVRFQQSIVLNHQRSFYHEIVLSWIDAAREFRLVPATYPHPSPDDQCTELHAHRRLAAQVLGRAVAWEEIVPRFTSFPVRDDGRLLVYPLSREGNKDLPAARVTAILRHWRQRHPAPIVLGGPPGAAAKLRDYASALQAAGVTDVSLETPDGVLAFVAHGAQAGALLAAESAAGHIGAAFDKPTAVLMAPPLYGYCQPWHRSARQRVFLFDEADEATVVAALAADGISR